jgi:hypothetical protein
MAHHLFGLRERNCAKNLYECGSSDLAAVVVVAQCDAGPKPWCSRIFGICSPTIGFWLLRQSCVPFGGALASDHSKARVEALIASDRETHLK